MTPDWGWAPPDPSHQVLAPLGSFPIRPPPSPTQGAPGRRIAAAAQLTSRHRHSLPLGTKSGTPAAKTGSFPPVKAGARPHCTTPAPPVPGPAARCGSARRRAAPAFPATLRRARTKPQVRRRVPLSPSPAPEAVSQPPSENRSREAGLSRALRPLPVRRPRGQLTLAGPPWGGGGSGSPRPRTHGRPDKDQPERSGPAGAGLGLAGTRGLPWPRATRRRAVTLLPAEHKETIEGCGPPPPHPASALCGGSGGTRSAHSTTWGLLGSMRARGAADGSDGTGPAAWCGLCPCRAVLWVPRCPPVPPCLLPMPCAGVWAHSHSAAAFTWHHSAPGLSPGVVRYRAGTRGGTARHSTARLPLRPRAPRPQPVSLSHGAACSPPSRPPAARGRTRSAAGRGRRHITPRPRAARPPAAIMLRRLPRGSARSPLPPPAARSAVT